jgi:hypothetical protein
LQNNITWAELKLAVKKFTTGDVRVTGFLSNGGRLSILANTADDGEEKLTALAKLTINEITRFTSGKQKLTLINRKPATGDRKRGDIRDEVPMYPAFAYFISRHPWREGGKDQPVKPDGYSSLSDAYYTKRQRFDLYVDNQPINYPVLL